MMAKKAAALGNAIAADVNDDDCNDGDADAVMSTEVLLLDLR